MDGIGICAKTEVNKFGIIEFAAHGTLVVTGDNTLPTAVSRHWSTCRECATKKTCIFHSRILNITLKH
jgi:hypothetical protein